MVSSSTAAMYSSLWTEKVLISSVLAKLERTSLTSRSSISGWLRRR